MCTGCIWSCLFASSVRVSSGTRLMHMQSWWQLGKSGKDTGLLMRLPICRCDRQPAKGHQGGGGIAFYCHIKNKAVLTDHPPAGRAGHHLL